MDFESHLTRQIAFSRATFGPGERTNGVLDHIAKEAEEVRKEADATGRADEWVDIAILGLDGLWRAVAAELVEFYGETPTSDEIAQGVVERILSKQGKNETRTWPDWRTASPDKAIEHAKVA